MPRARKKSILAIVASLALTAPLAAGALSASLLKPPSSAIHQAPTTQPQVPQWQIEAGGKQAFDVASVKQNKSTTRPYSSFSLGPGDGRVASGNLFSTTNFPLLALIGFAYKLTGSQVRDLPSQLPKWAATESFDIQARAEGNPTKDQMRLMLQSLLADRFKLAAHYETRQTPVFALVSNKSGQLGPHLRPHSEGSPCADATHPPASPSAPQPPATVAGGFPTICSELVPLPTAHGQVRFGARNVATDVIVSSLNAISDLDRPILDQTSLSGTFDFTIEFTLQLNGPPRPDANAQLDEPALTFQEALKDQLGLKLEPQKGPVEVLVIDHIEEPSPN